MQNVQCTHSTAGSVCTLCSVYTVYIVYTTLERNYTAVLHLYLRGWCVLDVNRNIENNNILIQTTNTINTKWHKYIALDINTL